MIHDFSEKYEFSIAKINLEPALEFNSMVDKILEILNFMAQKQEKKFTWTPSYAEYFAVIKNALAKGIVINVPTLLLLALRQWGPMYNRLSYMIYAMLLVMAYHGKPIEELNVSLTPQGVRTGSLLSLINRSPVPLFNEEII